MVIDHHMQYEILPESDFWKFFGIHEISEETGVLGRINKNLKPGGFQESVDLQMTLEKDLSVHQVNLTIERNWMGNLVHVNPFATDIMKSFIRQFGKLPQNPELEAIADHIEHFHGYSDNVIYVSGKEPHLDPLPEDLQGAIATIFGAHDWVFEGSDLVMKIENQRRNDQDWIHFSIEYTGNSEDNGIF